MIFERREYELRPGRLHDFWEAQEKWNVGESAAALIRNNLCYFSVAGSDRVVHLYRWNSLQHWQESYAEYYRTQVPEYFRTARPWVLRQENCILAQSPVPELSELWSGEVPQAPDEANALGEQMIVIERRLDLAPGGLPAYWDAHASLLAEPPDYWKASHMATLPSLIGRHHRVFSYQCFADMESADRFAETARADPRWNTYVAACRDQVVGGAVSVLRPSPVPEQRSLIKGGR